MSFITIFTEMSWIAGLLLAVGLVFIIVEVFVPGFGFFGIAGVTSVVAGIIVRICQGLNLEQALTLILLVLGFFFFGAMFMVYSAQYGILGRTGLFERKTTLPENHSNVPKELRKLIGKSGKAITDLSLAGKAKIKGETYDVISMRSYIEKGSHVKVVEIRDNEIVVRKWFE
ncbi:MAG: hypothetical protein E7374_00025 [Clostridiales bacterium]|nr:hypothetical protein [Clostridiales bacterium]